MGVMTPMSHIGMQKVTLNIDDFVIDPHPPPNTTLSTNIMSIIKIIYYYLIALSLPPPPLLSHPICTHYILHRNVPGATVVVCGFLTPTGLVRTLYTNSMK